MGRLWGYLWHVRFICRLGNHGTEMDQSPKALKYFFFCTNRCEMLIIENRKIKEFFTFTFTPFTLVPLAPKHR